MKLTNIKYTWITTVISVLFFTGCDLDRFPESELSDVVYWQTEKDYMMAANYLYRASHVSDYVTDYFLRADIMSDDAFGLGPNNISNGTFIPSSNFGPWKQDYQVIRAANNILEKAGSSSLAREVLARFEAEARFFRAYAYFDLVRRYGDVPLVLRSLDGDAEELYMERTPRGVVMDTIYKDLDYAAMHLPLAGELNIDEEYGRITSGAALTLKSRAALFEGTFNKYHGSGGSGASGNASYHLQIAKAAAWAVMQSGEYGLFDNYGMDSYRMLFKNAGEGPENKEAIWVYRYGFSEFNIVNSNKFILDVSIYGDLCVTGALVDSYLCADGLPIDKSGEYQGKTFAGSEFLNRDPRLDGTVVKPGDHYFNGYIIIGGAGWIPTMHTATGYPFEKYQDIDGGNLDHIMFRYAEVLLNYAEASYELNETISDADLDLSINLLRSRVGMPHLSNAFVLANDLNMREEIRRERRAELSLEGFRYNDLIRWKTAEIELPKPVLGVRFFDAEYPGDDPSSVNLTADSIVIAEAANKRSFDAAKHYLWPIPLNELSLNPNLKQNPNWE